MSLKTKLEEMRKRCEAATSGPWVCGGDSGWPIGSFSTGNSSIDSKDYTVWTVPMSSSELGEADAKLDAEFIAASRTDMPALIDALEVCLQALEYINTHELYHGVNQGMPSEQTSKEAILRVEEILGNVSTAPNGEQT